MKGVITVKVVKDIYYKEKERLVENFMKLPVIESCNWLSDTDSGFISKLMFTDKSFVNIQAVVMQRAYPSAIEQIVKNELIQNSIKDEYYVIIIAPYVSNESARKCEENNIGYMDMSGNYRIHIKLLFVSEQGHQNQYIQKRKIKSVFDIKSKVSSLILREIMKDVSYQWKLSKLSEKLQCSIGQVSKVKNYLCENLWADLSDKGLRIVEPESIMRAWSKCYSDSETDNEVIECYTLNSLSIFENSLKEIKSKYGIKSYLTGISGGVRYAPVVRYNKVHIMVREEDKSLFFKYAECKQVDSGANIQIMVVKSNELLHDARNINGYQIASPVQIYLDCMKYKGRGEEIAEKILIKEIVR